MKKLLWIAVALSLLALPTAAQEPTGYEVHLPLVTKDYCGEWPTMSDWHVVVPEATTNAVLNPSAEAAGNHAALPGTAVTRVPTYSKWGLYSYRVQTDADNEGISFTLSALANAVHYATARVRGTLPASWDWSLDNVIYTAPALIESLDADWSLYGLQFPAADAAGSTTLYIRQNDVGSGDFYLDGVQVEAKSYWTTYADGDRGGCEWNGAAHASTSSRSAQSRAGGRVRDLQTVYGFDVGGMVGAGTAPQTLAADEYAILPGGEVSGVKTHVHPFTLTGVIRGTSYADLHAKRQALVLLFDPDGVPPDADGPQPVRLRYTGAAVEKEIAVHYEGGLEGNVQATEPCWWERVAIRVLADDPFWYEIGESSIELDSAGNVYDTATFRLVAARLRSTGQWDDMGPPGVPGTAVYTYVRAIAEDDVYIYAGGDFVDFNNNANADYIVRYNKQTGAWSALGNGLNGIVWAIAIAPDGDVYVGGQFTQEVGGGANTLNYIARWDTTAGTWNAVGAALGLDQAVYALAFDQTGDLFVGGLFTDVFGGGGGAFNYIVRWDGAAYNAMGAGPGFDNRVFALAVGLDNTLFAGGQFTRINGGPAGSLNYCASWDGTSFSALSTGMAGGGVDVRAIAVSSAGLVYFGGQFTTSGGVTTNYIAVWNGQAFFALGTGADNFVYALDIGHDGTLFIGGIFTSLGGIVLADRVGKWNGSSFAHLDIDLPGGPTVLAVHVGKRDPVIEQNYDLWMGFTTTGAGYFAGTATATNGGTETAYPKIVVERSGANTATLEEVRNETIGKELLFDYDLVDGERLTIDLTPTEKSIISNFFGSRMDAILPGCDFGTFALQPGANQVTAFVAEGGAVTVTAWLLWVNKYNGYD